MKEVFKCPFMNQCFQDLNHLEWIKDNPVIVFDVPECKAPVFSYKGNTICKIAVDDDVTPDKYMMAMEKQIVKGTLFNRLIRKIFKC